MDDARERFLRAIVERIPAERIAELHLFPPLRQGGWETGVAVVAAWPAERVVPADLPPAVGMPAEEGGAAANPDDAAGIEITPPQRARASRDGTAGSSFPHPPDAARIESTPAEGPPASRDALAPGIEPHRIDADAIELHRADADATAFPGEADATAAFWEPEEATVLDDDAEGAGRHTPPVRLIVYRAGYRWTRKGVDRGKWEVEVRAEADAPLEAVADVVRGVHRRAGGEAEPERLSGDAVRVALSDRPWAAAT